MKKKIVALFLALCLGCSLLPTPAFAWEDVSEGSQVYEELEDFLTQFCFEAINEYEYYPFYSAGESSDILEVCFDLVGRYCYNDVLYPGEEMYDFWDERDPLGLWDSYFRVNEQKLDWILENIFNCSRSSIEQMKASLLTVPLDSRADPNRGGYNFYGNSREYMSGSVYYLNGYYYCALGGIGGVFSPSVSINEIKKVGDRYQVDISFIPDYDGYEIKPGYALVDRKNIGDRKCWSLYYISPVPEWETPTKNGGFVDVYSDSYFRWPVLWAVDQGITYGTGWANFSPEATCTKGQILTFLWRANGQPEPAVTWNPFVDVSPSDYYYKPALWAAEKGLLTSTTVRANDPCTRAMVVNYLWRLAGRPAASGSSFTDVPAGEDAQAVAWAVSKGITNGTGVGTFSPNAICTRGQIVTFLYRAR